MFRLPRARFEYGTRKFTLLSPEDKPHCPPDPVHVRGSTFFFRVECRVDFFHVSFHDSSGVLELESAIVQRVFCDRKAFDLQLGRDDTVGAKVELDGDVVRNAKQGDRTAHMELYRHYAPRLRGYFRRRGLGAGSIEDAVQETMTRLLTALERGEITNNSFGGWLFGTARNVLVDSFRERARQPIRRVESLGEATTETEQPYDRAELRTLVRHAIDALPDHLRIPLVLRHWQDLSYRRISERLGISENAVSLRLYRARQNLRRSLEGKI